MNDPYVNANNPCSGCQKHGSVCILTTKSLEETKEIIRRNQKCSHCTVVGYTCDRNNPSPNANVPCSKCIKYKKRCKTLAEAHELQSAGPSKYNLGRASRGRQRENEQGEDEQNEDEQDEDEQGEDEQDEDYEDTDEEYDD
jgi:hypothetical protein